MISSSLFSFLTSSILYGIIALILYLLFKFTVTPYKNLLFYKKQGIHTEFNPNPIFGNLMRGKEFLKKYKDGMGYYRHLAQTNPDIPAQAANFGRRINLVLYDPKYLKEFYSKQAFYIKSPFPGPVRTIMGTGILLAEGNTWKNHRKVISSKFHFEFLKQNVPLIVATAREFLGELSKTPMKKVHTLDEIQKITGEVIGRIFFGENLNQYKFKGEILTLYLAELMVRSSGRTRGRNYLIMIAYLLGLNMELFASFREIMNEAREFRQFCGKIIQDRKASNIKGQHDLLGMLLETQDSPNAEDRFSDEDITNEFITFFLAGMDTTGHLVTMALYMLTKHPKVFENLQKEINAIYTKNSEITIEELNQMECLQSILKETLRLYTPVPITFPRVAQADHELGDLKIKKGTVIRLTTLFNQSNSKYFEDPEIFKPERWLNKKDGEFNSYAFLPFSAGPRNCIGQHMAMIEAKIIICEFVKTFNFKVVPEDYEFVLGFNFLYGLKNKMYMDLEMK